MPKELCVCEAIAKESGRIKVSLVTKRYRKNMTIIKGVDTAKIDVAGLLKKLKSRLACGGTYKNNEIELQGDHRSRVRDILIKEGFPPEMIEVM